MTIDPFIHIKCLLLMEHLRKTAEITKINGHCKEKHHVNVIKNLKQIIIFQD